MVVGFVLLFGLGGLNWCLRWVGVSGDLGLVTFWVVLLFADCGFFGLSVFGGVVIVLVIVLVVLLGFDVCLWVVG